MEKKKLSAEDELKQKIIRLKLELETKRAFLEISSKKRLEVWENNFQIDELINKFIVGKEKSNEKTEEFLEKIKKMLPYKQQADQLKSRSMQKLEQGREQLTIEIEQKENIILQQKLLNEYNNDKLMEENTSLREQIIEMKQALDDHNEQNKVIEEEDLKLDERCATLEAQVAEQEEKVLVLNQTADDNEKHIAIFQEQKGSKSGSFNADWEKFNSSS